MIFRSAAIVLCLFCAIAPVGCGDDEDSIRDAELVGVWTATELVFIGTAFPHVEADVIAEGGTFALEFRADHTYKSSLMRSNMDVPRVRTGTWEITHGELVLVEAAPPSTARFDVEVLGDALTMSGGVVMYDFVAHGIFEAATVRAEFRRS